MTNGPSAGILLSLFLLPTVDLISVRVLTTLTVTADEIEEDDDEVDNEENDEDEEVEQDLEPDLEPDVDVADDNPDIGGGAIAAAAVELPPEVEAEAEEPQDVPEDDRQRGYEERLLLWGLLARRAGHELLIDNHHQGAEIRRVLDAYDRRRQERRVWRRGGRWDHFEIPPAVAAAGPDDDADPDEVPPELRLDDHARALHRVLQAIANMEEIRPQGREIAEVLNGYELLIQQHLQDFPDDREHINQVLAGQRALPEPNQPDPVNLDDDDFDNDNDDQVDPPVAGGGDGAVADNFD